MAGEKQRVPQLDMNHGFMHSIIKNQIDRDEYDKEQKLLKLQKDKEASPLPTTGVKEERKRKERRAPLHQVYIPPHQRKNMSSPEKDQDQPRQATELLLRLEFEGKDGGLHHLDIYKDDDLKKSVRIFAAKCSLDNRLRDALYQRLLDELRGS